MAVQVLRGNVIVPEGVIERGTIVIEDGKIVEVSESDSRTATKDYGDSYIAPGYVDIHMHGIAGADTMDAKAASIGKMAAQLATHGVTGFLPTTVTQSLELTVKTVEEIRSYMESQSQASGAEVLGIHLEGPWINKAAKGAQNEAFIVEPKLQAIDELLNKSGRTVRKVTLAPEVSGARDAIGALRSQGVHVSVGHTTASYDETVKAFELGADHVTHCFNAMTGLHHRNPGVVGAALTHDEVYTELIADGVHVHPAAMKIMFRAKGRDRLMLISDSIAAADMPDGPYSLGGLAVEVRDGQARLADGTLAGSTLTLDRAVRNMVNLCGIPVHDAVYMASTTPAEAIGFGNRKGRIAVGFDADLVVLNRDLYPAETIVAIHIQA